MVTLVVNPNRRYFQPAEWPNRWAIISVQNAIAPYFCREFIRRFTETARQRGLADCSIELPNRVHWDQWEESSEEFIEKKFKFFEANNCRFVIFFSKGEACDNIKMIEQQYKMVTQHIGPRIAKKVTRHIPGDSGDAQIILEDILLRINRKLGGINYTPNIILQNQSIVPPPPPAAINNSQTKNKFDLPDFERDALSKDKSNSNERLAIMNNQSRNEVVNNSPEIILTEKKLEAYAGPEKGGIESNENGNGKSENVNINDQPISSKKHYTTCIAPNDMTDSEAEAEISDDDDADSNYPVIRKSDEYESTIALPAYKLPPNPIQNAIGQNNENNANMEKPKAIADRCTQPVQISTQQFPTIPPLQQTAQQQKNISSAFNPTSSSDDEKEFQQQNKHTPYHIKQYESPPEKWLSNWELMNHVGAMSALAKRMNLTFEIQGELGSVIFRSDSSELMLVLTEFIDKIRTSIHAIGYIQEECYYPKVNWEMFSHTVCGILYQTFVEDIIELQQKQMPSWGCPPTKEAVQSYNYLSSHNK